MGLELTDTKKNDKIVIKLLTKSMNMKQNSAIQQFSNSVDKFLFSYKFLVCFLGVYKK